MAGRQRGNHGENDRKGYDFQLCCLFHSGLQIINFQHPQLRIKRYEIGSAIEGYGAMDDVVIKVTFIDEQHTDIVKIYAIQVKHVKDIKEKRIDSAYMFDNIKTNMAKYFFKTFLEFKDREQLEQMVIWSNMDFSENVRDWFAKYRPESQEFDLLGEASSDMTYERSQFTEKMKEEFKEEFHPRTALAKKFIDKLLAGKEWDVNDAAKDHYYSVMAKEIIECNEGEPKFKEEFVHGIGLSTEADNFRKCFMRIMVRLFTHRNFGKFSMDKLNDYHKHRFKLKIHASFKNKNSMKEDWKKWTDVPSDEDVNEFFRRFVFYTKVPSLELLKKNIGNELRLKQICSYEEWYTLMEECAFTKTVSDTRVGKLLKLLELRRGMDCGPYLKLQFDDSNNLKRIGPSLNVDNRTVLYIKAIQNVDCTLSRLIGVVERELEPNCARYLVLNYATYHEKLADLEKILEDPKLIAIGLKCIIMTCVPSNEMKEISEKFSAVTVIFVAKEFNADLTTIDDEFNVDSINKYNKIKIQKTKIKLSATQCATAKDIFGDDLFRQDYHQIVLELYKTEQNKPIVVSENKLEKDPHYSPRLTQPIDINEKSVKWDLVQQAISTLNASEEQKKTEGKLIRYVVCDQPGMGKSTELVRIAVELRENYKDYMVVLLNCKTVASKWDGDMVKIVCDSLTFNNEFSNVLVEKMFQKGKIILLMDGYDEVVRDNHSNLEELLAMFSNNEMFKSVMIFIATRPHCMDKIRSKMIDCIECQLEPFNEKHQEQYLKSVFEYKNKDSSQQLIIENNIRVIINSIRAILDKSIIGIPLQSCMIAALYKNDISFKDLKALQPYEIGLLYDEYISFMCNESINRFYDNTSEAHNIFKKQARKTFFEGHIQIALAIFRNDTSKVKELCTEHQSFGLVKSNPLAEFNHPTFSEYFLVLHFLHCSSTNDKKEKNKEDKKFKTFMKQHFCQSRVGIVTKIIDFHIGKLNSKTNEHSTSTIDDHFKGVPSEKIIEYFRSCSPSECYTLLRGSLNISVFNVFELLYDNLSDEAKTELRFTFGRKPQSNFGDKQACGVKPVKIKNIYQGNLINLKQLGENQVLHLLKILQKKHPDDFVQLYLTAFSDEEEDFIEVACRKPFSQVFKWLTAELVPNLILEDVRTLQEYVERRFKKYFALIIQHNNVEFLKEIISWFKEVWPAVTRTESAKKFLQDNTVMRQFVTNVELKAKSKNVETKLRADMVNVMFDLYEWAFGDSTLTDKQCIEAINNIQTAAIREAFDDIFLLNG